MLAEYSGVLLILVRAHERIHAALGDAWTKAGEFEKGRQAWQKGLEDFPDSEALKARLATEGDEAQLDYVEEERNLEQRIDTDLSFYDDSLGRP